MNSLLQQGRYARPCCSPGHVRRPQRLTRHLRQRLQSQNPLRDLRSRSSSWRQHLRANPMIWQPSSMRTEPRNRYVKDSNGVLVQANRANMHTYALSKFRENHVDRNTGHMPTGLRRDLWSHSLQCKWYHRRLTWPWMYHILWHLLQEVLISHSPGKFFLDHFCRQERTDFQCLSTLASWCVNSAGTWTWLGHPRWHQLRTYPTCSLEWIHWWNVVSPLHVVNIRDSNWSSRAQNRWGHQRNQRAEPTWPITSNFDCRLKKLFMIVAVYFWLPAHRKGALVGWETPPSAMTLPTER